MHNREIISKILSLGYLFKPGPTKIKTRIKNMHRTKKILIIRSGAIGDCILTIPLIKELKKIYPDSKIDYLVGDWSKTVLKNEEEINEIIGYKDEIVVQKKIWGIIGLIRKIRKTKYDIGIILDKSWEFGVLASLMKIPNRIGYDRAGEGFANHINIKYDGNKYEGEYYFDIIRKLKQTTENKEYEVGRYELSLTIKPEEIEHAKQKFIEKNMSILEKYKDELQYTNNNKQETKYRNIIGLAIGGAKNPGAEMANKKWPQQNYTEIIKELSKHNKIILFGGKTDKEIHKQTIENIENQNIIDMAGETNIHETAVLMKECDLLITHDSGPMHIAGTTQKPLIAIFGPTPAERFAPKNAHIIKSTIKECPTYTIYGEGKKIDCMAGVGIDAVKNKIQEILPNAYEEKTEKELITGELFE